MNLLDSRIRLLVLVAFTFFACEEEVGELNLNPENNLGIFFAESSLENNIKQVWAGSAPSSFSGLILTGSYNDSIFGITKARAYCDISVGLASFDLTTISTAELRDLELSLRITDAVGNFDSQDLQKFTLYKLADVIEDEENLTTSSTIALGEKVGEIEFNLFADSIGLELEGIVDTSRYDANGFYNYLTTFELTDSYKDEFIDAFINSVETGVADANDMDDIDSLGYFLDQNLKGLAIIPDENNTAIITYNINDVENYSFQLDYTIENNESNRVDQEASFILNSLKSFNNITPNEDEPWNDGVFQGVVNLNEPFVTNTEYVYLETGTNMLFTIDISGFNTLKDSIPNAIIQRAVLSLKNVPEENSTTNLPFNLSALMSTQSDISDGILSNLTDNSVLNDLPSSFEYNEDDETYQVEIPLYLQGIADGTIPYDQLVFDINSTLRDAQLNNFFVQKKDITIRFYYSISN